MQATTESNNFVPLASAAILFFLLSMSWGCATGGGLVADAEVNRIFREDTVLPGYNYYYFGREGEPEAVIAVNKEYQLQSAMWKPVDFTPGQLKKWLYYMEFKYGMSKLAPSGYRIVTPEGQPVGMWYSPWNWTVVKLGDKRQVEIYPPDVKENPWQRDQEGSRLKPSTD